MCPMNVTSLDPSLCISAQSDLLYSSSIRRKINRHFFRNDLALKSYKCNLLGTNIDTPAKVYVSNSAIYIVHRPKRRKLTTIPFSEVTDLAHREDTGSVEIHLSDRMVYTLTNFQRPEPAITFLVNFWEFIRKEQIVSKAFTPPSAPSMEHSGTTERRFPTSDTTHPRLADPLLSISLNNSASVSETESILNRKAPSITRMFPSTTDAEPSSEQVEKMVPSVVHSCPSTSSLEEEMLNTPLLKSAKSSPENTYMTIPKANSECVTTQRSPVMSPLSGETAFSLPPLNTRESNQLPTCHSFSKNRTMFADGSARGHKPSIHLSESSNWSIWPLSFLPYPFSPSPQRFTIIIAYAILAFLLFSTLHLYHRVTLFNPNMDTTMNLPERFPRAPSISNDPRDHLDALELRLSQLVDLTAALAKSLAQMANELNRLQKEVKSENLSYEDTSVN